MFFRRGRRGAADVPAKPIDDSISADAVRGAIVSRTPLTIPASADRASFMRGFDRVMDADPSLFWVGRRVEFDIRSDPVPVTFQYLMDADEASAAAERISGITARVLEETAGMTDLQKETRIHDMLARTVYADDGPLSHTMYGPLVDGRGVCDGIAMAFCHLCRAAGIGCRIVRGTIGGREPHAWDIVTLGGRDYHVDVTHDLVCNSYPGCRAYLNVTDRDISGQYSWDGAGTCDSTGMNYHAANGLMFRTIGDADPVLRRALRGGSVEIRISRDPGNDGVTRRVSELMRAEGVRGNVTVSTPGLGVYLVRVGR